MRLSCNSYRKVPTLINNILSSLNERGISIVFGGKLVGIAKNDDKERCVVVNEGE